MALAATMLFSGCNQRAAPPKDRAFISGVVSLDGTPLKGGNVHFELQGSTVMQSTTLILQDGTYQTDAAPVGDVLVSIETESLKLGAPAEFYVRIPEHYGDTKTSGLKTAVTAGERTEYNIELKSDAKPL